MAEVVFIMRSEGGSVWHYDTVNVQKNGDYRYVWIEGDHRKNRSVIYRSSKSRYMINCKSDYIEELDHISYLPNGDIVNSQRFNEYSRRASTVVPGTLGEALWTWVCLVYNQ